MKVSERMRGYRTRKQAAGLRLVQLWVPDTRSKRFAAECRRQSRLLKGDPAEAEMLEFIARAGAWDDHAPR
ncbi:MAG: antitoxin MazE family protein [Betaproteobacteria bacterium]|nr:antitoxin MazE family protein [Betaproteobacteria bacterium]